MADSKLVKQLHDKETEAKSIFEAMTSGDFTDEKTQAMQAKFDELMVEIDALKENIEREKKLAEATDFLTAPAIVTPRGQVLDTNGRGQFKSLSDIFTESDAYKAEKGRIHVKAQHSLPAIQLLEATERKAIYDAVTDGLTGYTRPPQIYGLGTERPTIASILGSGTTSDPTVRHTQEVAFVNAAVEVAVGADKPEAEFDFLEVDSPVRDVAVLSRITKQTLRDFGQIRQFIDERLARMVALRVDSQLLNGNGTPPNLRGITRTPNIQTEEYAGGVLAESILNAIQKVRTVGFFEPDYVVMHPNDWKKLVLEKDGNEQYFGGGYFMGQYGNGSYANPGAIWGIPIIQTTAIGELPGTGAGGNIGLGPLVGAFGLGATVFYNGGMMVEAFEQDRDNVQKNLVTIRAEQALALAVTRPVAFCQVVNLVV
jgi:HK97 family phage major capsid protein